MSRETFVHTLASSLERKDLHSFRKERGMVSRMMSNVLDNLRSSFTMILKPRVTCDLERSFKQGDLAVDV